jgi:hypothetical protein
MAERPAPDREVPDGFELAAVEEKPSAWRLQAGYRCRAGAGYRKPACGKPSVAALLRQQNRNSGGQWWAYCGEHLYGRWIEDGKIMHWILRETGDG